MNSVFELIAIPIAIVTVCTISYMGSRVLLFGLVKPEDVESPLGGSIPSSRPDVLLKRKPVSRSPVAEVVRRTASR